jgi:hypothetical protein
MEIWCSSLHFGLFFPVLLFCTKKNLATLYITAALGFATVWNEKKELEMIFFSHFQRMPPTFVSPMRGSTGCS